MGSSGKLIFGRNVRRFREGLAMTQEALAEASDLDRSYIGGIERGQRNPTLAAILRIASALRVAPASLFDGIGNSVNADTPRDGLTAVAAEDGLIIRFKYDQYDAEYHLPGATQSQLDDVLNVLKNGLAAGGPRADTVADAFRRAVQIWPVANPSDLWTFLINRAYCDRANHPDANARLNLEQSWKRASGWALERVLIAHYGPFLARNRVTIKISNKAEKTRFLGDIPGSNIVPDKADILLTYGSGVAERLLGVVNVKASIAERRTDDVPMSQALINAGYLSVFWTMDSKSFPAERPVNRGEFGASGDEQVSDKRRDFEEHGHFSACFSYNRNTIPTSDAVGAVAQIFVCDFNSPDDLFSKFLITAQRHHSAQ